MATTKQKKKHGAGSEGSFKACLLESFLCGVWSCYLKAFTEAKRLNKQQDLAWIFGQFQEPSKAKNKLREHKSEKPLSFQPNILSKLLLFYVYEVLAKREKWLICEAMQLGPNIFWALEFTSFFYLFNGWNLQIISTCEVYVDYIQASFRRKEENNDKKGTVEGKT